MVMMFAETSGVAVRGWVGTRVLVEVDVAVLAGKVAVSGMGLIGADCVVTETSSKITAGEVSPAVLRAKLPGSRVKVSAE